VAYGPILESDLQMGESYDARLEFGGWDQPDFDEGPATFPTAGWLPVQVFADTGVALVATNGPSVVALGTAAGARTVDPAPLGSVPSSGTPAVQLGNGLRGLFAADTGGGVTAVDLASGGVAWSRTLAPESFVGGVTGALSSMLPAAYGTDVLFLGSTTGNLLALDARTGAPLWTLPVGTAVRSLATYDFTATSWRLYVATDGGGILAYDLVGAAQPGAPAWTSAAAAYTLGCISQSTTSLACATSAGEVQLVDKASGAVTASLLTGLTTPTSLWRAGSGALVVSNASQVVRLTVSAGALAESGRYAPGLTLGKPQVFVADGFVYVGGSDLMVHKLSLSNLAEILPAAALTSPAAGAVLGQPAYDTTTDRLLVGVSDGRVWALPKF
jgi:outer membrane protein assembly factor BamB